MNREADGSPGGSAEAHRSIRMLPVLIAIPAAFLLAATLNVSCLTARDSGGRITAWFPVGTGLPFSIGYIHSVALLPCTDYLTALPDGRIRVDGTTFSGLGAGLPSGEDGTEFSVENGTITIGGMERYYPSIAVLPSHLPNHTITIGDRVYEVRVLTGKSGPGKLRVERLPVVLLPGLIGTGYSSLSTEVNP